VARAAVQRYVEVCWEVGRRCAVGDWEKVLVAVEDWEVLFRAVKVVGQAALGVALIFNVTPN
jgi:hypothetical protein